MSICGLKTFANFTVNTSNKWIPFMCITLDFQPLLRWYMSEQLSKDTPLCGFSFKRDSIICLVQICMKLSLHIGCIYTAGLDGQFRFCDYVQFFERHAYISFKSDPLSWHFILPVRFSYLSLLHMRTSILLPFSHTEQQYLMYLHYCKG